MSKLVMARHVISAAPLGQTVGWRIEMSAEKIYVHPSCPVVSLTPHDKNGEDNSMFESAVTEAAHNSLDVVEALKRGR